MGPVLLLLVVIFVVLVFTYTNGFHDAANAIATVVATKVLTARQAVLLGSTTNFIGALCGVAVAKTIGAGLVDSTHINTTTVFCAMLAGIVWNLTTWYYGMPSSSSHALIGGLLGAALASSRNNWSVIIWSVTKTDTATGTVVTDGLLPKVIVPMLASPVLGFVGGMCVMGLLFAIIRHFRPAAINHLFAKAQLASATYMGWAHGFADGQKTMGIIALACYVATTQKNLDHAPAWLGFLRTPEFKVASWVQWSCAVSMALGTYAGGWRIIRTIGHSLVRLKPVQGFAAETTAASLLLVCGRLGMPVSTTHLITTAIMGVGCAKRFNTLNWTLVERIVWTWTLTLPGTAILAYLLVCASRLFN